MKNHTNRTTGLSISTKIPEPRDCGQNVKQAEGYTESDRAVGSVEGQEADLQLCCSITYSSHPSQQLPFVCQTAATQVVINIDQV